VQVAQRSRPFGVVPLLCVLMMHTLLSADETTEKLAKALRWIFSEVFGLAGRNRIPRDRRRPQPMPPLSTGPKKW
jgi:hypothetical protein